MNQVSTSLVVFGIAILATALVLVVHRKLLPHFGIRIGTELVSAAPKQPHKHVAKGRPAR
jgi:NADH:ubiquinone oxidoreductase subunit H